MRGDHYRRRAADRGPEDQVRDSLFHGSSPCAGVAEADDGCVADLVIRAVVRLLVHEHLVPVLADAARVIASLDFHLCGSPSWQTPNRACRLRIFRSYVRTMTCR